jgi:hypothetical protein
MVAEIKLFGYFAPIASGRWKIFGTVAGVDGAAIRLGAGFGGLRGLPAIVLDAPAAKPQVQRVPRTTPP